jgi:hypothetical protein
MNDRFFRHGTAQAISLIPHFLAASARSNKIEFTEWALTRLSLHAA